MSLATLACSALALVSGALAVAPVEGQRARPNIIVLLADDLGYGDVSCYGATRVRTPNVDRLADQGLRFTDGHSSSATCTPSRYALLTGEYPWRRPGTNVLPGNASLIIDPARATLPRLLQKAGYATGAVGKWHLGLGTGNLDWNGDIKPGPLELGFDYCFIMPATGDRVPCVYVENHRIVGLDPADPIEVSYDKAIRGQPTGKKNPELLKLHPSHGHDMTIVNGISRIGYMSGGKAARWTDEDMADTFAARAVDFVEKNKDRPFFLYFATHDIHVPRVPHARFAGKSGLGARGDVILQFDDTVRQLVAALERLKLLENTLLIVTSDNGPVIDDGYRDEAVARLNGHQPSGTWRGGKYSIFEAGTRVPLIVHWPARVKPGTSDALISQIDLFASLADLTGQKLAEADAPDSLNVMPALLGESRQGRDELVEHAWTLALRRGPLKYIEPGKGPQRSPFTNIELGNDPAPQLYDLARDGGERSNLAETSAGRVKEFGEALQAIRKAPRARPASR